MGQIISIGISNVMYSKYSIDPFVQMVILDSIKQRQFS